MVKLIQCKSCGKEVAKSAKSCPNCGQKLKMGFFKKALIGFGVLFAIGVVAYFGEGDNGLPLVEETDAAPKRDTKRYILFKDDEKNNEKRLKERGLQKINSDDYDDYEFSIVVSDEDVSDLVREGILLPDVTQCVIPEGCSRPDKEENEAVIKDKVVKGEKKENKNKELRKKNQNKNKELRKKNQKKLQLESVSHLK